MLFCSFFQDKKMLRLTAAAAGARAAIVPVMVRGGGAALMAAKRSSETQLLLKRDFSLLDTATVAAVATACTALYGVNFYKIGAPGEYIVKTGIGIKDMSISRQTMVWPFQKHQNVEVNPSTYSFHLHCMSKGKVEFELPVVFTIGPILPGENYEDFQKYCQLMLAMPHEELERTIKGIIEGETRGLTAQLDVEEMFNGKEKFRAEVVEKLAIDLKQFGLKIYNANIQEMRDLDEKNKYFEYRKKRAIEAANNEARADVAEAQMAGDIAVSERAKNTRITVADNDRDAVIREAHAKIQMLKAQADLAVQEAATKQATEVSNVEAEQKTTMRRQELQAEVERLRYNQQVEATRAEIVTKAQAEAEARRHLADATFYVMTKEAEGKLKLMEASAEGVNKMVAACASNPELAKFYVGTESGLWNRMAEVTAEGIRDMKPQITIVGSHGQEQALSKTVMETMYGMAPLLQDVYAKFGSSKPVSVPAPSQKSS